MNETSPSPPQRSWSRTAYRLALGLLACTLISLFFTSQWFINPTLSMRVESWTKIFLHSLLSCYVWGLLTIVIARFTSWRGLDRTRWLREIGVYFSLGVALSTVQFMCASAGHWAIAAWFNEATSFWEMLRTHMLGSFHSNMIIYTIIASVCLVVVSSKRLQERELRESKLQSQLTEAQLAALKSQLHPHFLFNTLNAISALIQEDPEAAERMLVRLSDLLRMTLDNINTDTTALAAEIEFAKRYLEIERVRFGERLVVEYDVEPETLSAATPTFLLQPLIENAIRHGVSAVSTPCVVRVAARRAGSALVLAVEDTGPGRNDANSGRGLGLTTTNDRLRHLHGDSYQFTAENRDQGGFAARIEIPYTEFVRTSTQLHSSLTEASV